ncbi:hypothetical protein DFP72DRAFT_866681 [Ephemerocybe angulata]|uniref:Carcinoembryonic antigen-related cell adhesion molecule 1 n=1 Tax=Ephemerocybe angulata TaxID=980116 RepID=A0A8H6IK47_9AGAR|nr:hypothetical protein DFP72DRAFT_866681 [Tulosesus angulatus]
MSPVPSPRKCSLSKLFVPLGWILLVGSTLAPSGSLAALVNSTVDDSFPDPLTGDKIAYTPDGVWTDGKSCQGCSAQPSEQSLYRGTWHQGTFNSSDASKVPAASMTFKGTAIYVYCVLPRTTDNPSGYASMTFLIDGQPAGTFEKTPPDGQTGYDYDVLVYSKTGLPDKIHYFVLQVGKGAASDTLALLDKIVYSYDDGKKGTQLGAIIGGVLAGLIVLGAIAAILYWRYARRPKLTPIPQLDQSDNGSVTDYPTIVPFITASPTETNSHGQAQPRHSPSDSSLRSPTSTRTLKSRGQPTLHSRPSAQTIASTHGYDPSKVDIYDPYHRLSISAGTTTTYFGPSMSSGSATVHADNPPAYEPESIPLSPQRRSSTDKKKKPPRQSGDRKG